MKSMATTAILMAVLWGIPSCRTVELLNDDGSGETESDTGETGTEATDPDSDVIEDTDSQPICESLLLPESYMQWEFYNENQTDYIDVSDGSYAVIARSETGEWRLIRGDSDEMVGSWHWSLALPGEPCALIATSDAAVVTAVWEAQADKVIQINKYDQTGEPDSDEATSAEDLTAFFEPAWSVRIENLTTFAGIGGKMGIVLAPLSDGAVAVAGAFTESLTLGTGQTGETTLTAIPDAVTPFIARYNGQNGELEWARILEVPMSPLAIGTDDAGQIFVAGMRQHSADLNLITAVFADTGNALALHERLVVAEDPRTSNIVIPSQLEMDAASDRNGGWFLMGNFYDMLILSDDTAFQTTLFAPVDVVTEATWASSPGYFIAHYDSTGGLEWASNIYSDFDNYALGRALSMDVDSQGNLLFVGTTTGRVVFGENEYTETVFENSSQFVASYRRDGTLAKVTQLAGIGTVIAVQETVRSGIMVMTEYGNQLRLNPLCDDAPVAGDITPHQCEHMATEGWPCTCQNSTECDDGSVCVGCAPHDDGYVGICSPVFVETDPITCPDNGTWGTASTAVCDGPLSSALCYCVVSGCTANEDCPIGQVCVEPSCLASEPGCEEGLGETPICHPDNW